MSSSYVEVRESENGTAGDMMDFQINDCENGLDIRTQVDGEPPKDHTYTKEPAVDQISMSSTKNDVEMNDNEGSPKKSGRTPRNIKHKFIKPRNDERAKSPSKKDNPKKSSRTKASLSNTDEADVEKNKISKTDAVEETTPEPDSPKKRDRKRKANDKIVDEESDQKESKKKKSKPNSEKELEEEQDVNEGSEDLFDSKDDVKEKTPVKKLKNTKAKSHKKVEKTPVSKTPKKEIENTPKSKVKPVKKEVRGAASDHLPPGWTRKVVERKSGKTAGMFDVYIYSPEGLKFRSRPDIAAYLEKTKSKLRADDFSFKRGIGSTDVVTPANSTKKSSKSAKVTKPSESQKKKSGTTPKKGTKLRVKINTPKKRTTEGKSKMKASSYIDSQPSTSGLQSKRTGGSKKKKNA